MTDWRLSKYDRKRDCYAQVDPLFPQAPSKPTSESVLYFPKQTVVEGCVGAKWVCPGFYCSSSLPKNLARLISGIPGTCEANISAVQVNAGIIANVKHLFMCKGRSPI
ncbi:hypothetical protein MPH_10884 [Macrophomina phaseolina MS6]|uniref:Uncharacterized protein n=1 Tax=Macrophomina phaseolina (strain MS6) TaxID=1126212 RepID=K2RP78_MACPH|nr:hypothetical protein MPH_10884 [Macrophomina phaseolina MS6]